MTWARIDTGNCANIIIISIKIKYKKCIYTEIWSQCASESVIFDIGLEIKPNTRNNAERIGVCVGRKSNRTKYKLQL